MTEADRKAIYRAARAEAHKVADFDMWDRVMVAVERWERIASATRQGPATQPEPRRPVWLFGTQPVTPTEEDIEFLQLLLMATHKGVARFMADPRLRGSTGRIFQRAWRREDINERELRSLVRIVETVDEQPPSAIAVAAISALELDAADTEAALPREQGSASEIRREVSLFPVFTPADERPAETAPAFQRLDQIMASGSVQKIIGAAGPRDVQDGDCIVLRDKVMLPRAVDGGWQWLNFEDTDAVVTDLDCPGWDSTVQAETSTGALTEPDRRALQVWKGGYFYALPYPMLRQPNVSVMRWIRDAD